MKAACANLQPCWEYPGSEIEWFRRLYRQVGVAELELLPYIAYWLMKKMLRNLTDFSYLIIIINHYLL